MTSDRDCHLESAFQNFSMIEESNHLLSLFSKTFVDLERDARVGFAHGKIMFQDIDDGLVDSLEEDQQVLDEQPVSVQADATFAIIKAELQRQVRHPGKHFNKSYCISRTSHLSKAPICFWTTTTS